MPQKPAQQGIKVWALADQKNYYYSWSIFRGVSEKAIDTLIRISKTLPLDKFKKFYFKIVSDSYFGSTKVIQQLLDIGINFTLACKSDRESKYFKNGLHKIVEPGQWRSCVKKINYSIEENTPNPEIDQEKNIYKFHKVILTTFRDLKKKQENKKKPKTTFVNFISNCDDDELTTNENTKSENKKKKPKIVKNYSLEMNYVDKADKNIYNYIFNHKHLSWKRCCIIYFFKVLFHNSQIVFNSLNDSKLTTINFLLQLAEELPGKQGKPSNCKHNLDKSNIRKDCYFCRRYASKSSSTWFKCLTCDRHFHKKCFLTSHYCVLNKKK
ncbi:piggybac transposable element-derived protein [Anaeramoeba flamelloides]|uniref:Piggybac transposable element-derived protein n=1 Tax=Anaeramoeba flamelloides TaxID=1746091 RepID=A0ABQ8Z7T7_9EUKA|nr:piggybac transposable element-derived protein [Anaeramoeba flamelloides]